MAKRIFIGVGHGGSDSGAVKYIVEKEYTLKTAKLVAEYLDTAGLECKLSRTADVDTDMESKIKMCNDYKPDLVVDIHYNAGGGKGFEVYYSIVEGTSKNLAENINREVKKIMSSRGIKTKLGSGGYDYFGIIRDTYAPAVLCEGGFVDNKDDAEYIKANYSEIARAYADGILKTLKISDKSNVLDKTGYKEGDSTIGSLALKELLLIAKSMGLTSNGMDENRIVGDGTLRAINGFLKEWGYDENGIAGENFIKRLKDEITKKK